VTCSSTRMSEDGAEKAQKKPKGRLHMQGDDERLLESNSEIIMFHLADGSKHGSVSLYACRFFFTFMDSL